MSRNARTRSVLMAAILSLSASVAIGQEQPATPAQNLPSIIVTPAETRDLVDRVVASGTLRAEEEVQIQPQVEGLQIETLNVDVGDKVEAQTVVAKLSQDTLQLQRSQYVANRAKAEAALAQYQAQLVEAEASLEEAQRQSERATRLASSGSVSASQKEQAETALASATARVETARQAITVAEADIKVVDSQIADTDLRLARTDIKSPVAGTVSVRNARIGAIASGAGQPLFTVIRDGQIELVADVPETDILRLKAGQKAEVSVAGSDRPLSGSVRLVSPVIDPVTRLGAVHIALDDDAAARAGMYGSASIVVQEANGVALPLSAITTEAGKTTVRKVADGTVEMVEIKTGIQDGAYIQVTEGLNDGDKVVAKAGVFVRDGDRINPVEETSSVSN
ncbi:efflux RND transporter periplasmic adaptor subunit [Rhizobium rosettiformans]|uniref:Efflux RND transporter periplasmic adaptor subunit n=2 Tax=Rhizobium rosettiformans TaxID=1368430 RepID=A0A4S8QDW0_9HYPH|nr:efflux RND transporter periplasmic adaptor subunit [Rhizobium rosettiformans]THV39349.1 efflux RND transporter periplasmic adaptor subunit [Rhizobium rosettiformans W3]